ncbi:RmlC-like cupin domain-containing protein [Ilyonectria sp. MPI-CAGE-AT-0026]|nr:RmlC-like cupin domain-containing protein [Ilyonectria sp. MPI-CAGE-AT-0026]
MGTPAQMQRLNPPAPAPRTVPHLWSYDTIRPYLLRAGALITEKQAERRVLMLTNPTREAPYTTDTLYAGLQLVQPRETAPAHRHTAFACRFIIEGRGGFTARPRDVIVTPTWNWHAYGKKGADEEGGDDQPVIWLDRLNLLNFMYFPIHFVKHYASSRHPAKDKNNLFDRVIGASAERLEAGSESPVMRETASSVYHVIEGSGHSKIGESTISWKQGDTFCIPAWHRYQHFSDEGVKVSLYRFDDKPMLNALGFYRAEGDDMEKFVSG